MSKSALRYQKPKTHADAIGALRMNDCRCTATHLCQTCNDLMPVKFELSKREFDDIINSLDAGRAYE